MMVDFSFMKGLCLSPIYREKHIYHLYVVANIDARSRVTDLLNDAFEARKLLNLYTVSQTITITFITILTLNYLKLKEQNIQLEFRNIR